MYIANTIYKIRYTIRKNNWLKIVYFQSIVEAHGDRMWAKNNADGEKGATF
jgi:hypothetical protein